MKCQYCNQNEAENSFVVYINGESHTIHLCKECTERMKQYAGAVQWPAGAFPPPWGQQAAMSRRELGEDPFPYDAGEAIKHKRLLNELHSRLEEAIAAENYEEAAELRDKIASIKKDVYVYES